MTDYDLTMPFIVCTSNGGPFDDQAFVAGYECGYLDSYLEVCNSLAATPSSRYVHTNVLLQLDLLCMEHNFTLTDHATDESGEWTWVSFTPEES